MLIYKGTSLLDGATSIVAIAIPGSKNSKTGDMVQTYILLDEVDPLKASKTGADFAICGDCRHRGAPTQDSDRRTAKGRTCYVTLAHGPANVYKSYQAGKYQRVVPADVWKVGAGRFVRLGTYGDPAAVPVHIWHKLLSASLGHTAYSHQDKHFDPSIYMRSADSRSDAYAAAAAGHRSYRVISQRDYKSGRDAPIDGLEILCPASAEAGRRTTCIDCLLCSGAGVGKSIAIVAHGTAGGGV